MTSPTLKSAVPLLVLAIAVSVVEAQIGELRVHVVDPAGEPLPGATVIVTNEESRVPPTAIVTDVRGWAVFPILVAGPGYTVDVSMPGYARQRTSDLRIHSEASEQIAIRLGQELEERVSVTADRGPIELEETHTSTKFPEQVIENLPVLGRFYQNLLTLAPGVNDSDEDGNPNVHGARTRDFKAVVNGISNADPLTGQWMSHVNPESIEELEVITAGAGVEFGRAQGGFARVIQKQGSNEFEGVVSVLYRSSDFDGAVATSLDTKQDFESWQPSFQLSGPIVRDRLWFRLSHEIIDREDPVDLLNGFAIIGHEQGIHADQITWQVSPRNKLELQYQVDPLEIRNYTVSTQIPEESSLTLNRGGETFSLKWTSPVSARFLTESQVAWQDHRVDLVPTTTGVEQSCVVFEEFQFFNQGRCFHERLSRFSGSHYESTRDHRQRLTVRNQSVYYVPRFLGTSHKLKLGVSVENERYHRALERGTDMQFLPTPDNSLGEVTVTMAVPPSGTGRTTGTNYSFWAEDQIKPATGLQITAGLRVDREEILARGQDPFDPQAEWDNFLELFNSLPTGGRDLAFSIAFTHYPYIHEFRKTLADMLGFREDEIGLSETLEGSQEWFNSRRLEDVNFTNTNVSPRISVAWDPWTNGKTKIAFTAGRYYDKLFLGIPLVEIEPPSTTLRFATRTIQGRQRAFGLSQSFAPTISIQTVDRDLATPYNDEYTLSFEREILPETTVKATYIHRKFRDQLQDIEINHTTGDRGACVLAGAPGGATVVPVPGVGELLVDPWTGEAYNDTADGPGDGRIDDCTGNIVQFSEFDPPEVVPDGLPDLYVLNPGWGEVLLIGNFNKTDYESWVVEVIRRLYRSWQLNASYTWSEAVGDAEDFDQVLGNERNLVEDERGFLSYDQRHVARLHFTTVAARGVRLGAFMRWESGTPWSVLQSRNTILAAPPEFSGGGGQESDFRLRYPTRQRNDQRNRSSWNLDLRIAKELRIAKTDVQLTAEVFNVLDDQTERVDSVTNGLFVGERRFGRRFQVGTRVAF